MTQIRGLGYVKVQTQHMDRWRELALEGLGFAEGSGPDPDALYLRMDERRARLILVPGDGDGVQVIGWEVRDKAGLEAVREAVEKSGREVATLSKKEAAERFAEEVISFEDPTGTTLEVFFGPVLDHSPVVTCFAHKFITGPLGMGHVVLPTMDMDGTVAFYRDVLGFLGRGAMRVGGPRGPRLRFMGVNQRHHSLAIAPAPHQGDPGLVHMMVEADTLDSVGMALDAVTRLGFSISSTLGRHTNDKMVSFYVRTPGGWDIEYGCEGLLIDETYYTEEEISRDSYWGHDWSKSEPLAAFVPPSPGA